MFGELYHNRVLELAADIPHVGQLDGAQGSSLKVSRVCGSTVQVDVTLDATFGAWSLLFGGSILFVGLWATKLAPQDERL